MSKIIEIADFQCQRCGRTAEAETGSKIMCQTCVNEFLATNVGMMQEVLPEAEQPEQPTVRPLPPTPTTDEPEW